MLKLRSLIELCQEFTTYYEIVDADAHMLYAAYADKILAFQDIDKYEVKQYVLQEPKERIFWKECGIISQDAVVADVTRIVVVPVAKKTDNEA